MTTSNQQNYMENLLTDRLYFVEWAQANGLIDRLARNNPLLNINPMTVRQSLDRAVGYLVQDGVSIRMIWSYADLVTTDAFKAIIQNAMAASPADARRIAVVMLAVAQEWILVEPDVAHALQHLSDRFAAVTPRRVASSTRHQFIGRRASPKHVTNDLAVAPKQPA